MTKKKVIKLELWDMILTDSKTGKAYFIKDWFNGKELAGLKRRKNFKKELVSKKKIASTEIILKF